MSAYSTIDGLAQAMFRFDQQYARLHAEGQARRIAVATQGQELESIREANARRLESRGRNSTYARRETFANWIVVEESMKT